MDDEDDQFEAMEALYEDSSDGTSESVDESDLLTLRRYLQNPKFPENLAMAWTLALSLQPCSDICTYAAQCIQDTSKPCRDLAAQYLRLQCTKEFDRCLDRVLEDDDLDVRFEGLDRICDTDRNIGIEGMIEIVEGLSHSNLEIVRQYLVDAATKKHVATLRKGARSSVGGNVYNDLLATLAELRPELVLQP